MKKFWRILKKLLTIAAVLSGAALFVVVLTSAIQKQDQLTCKSLHVKIDYDSGLAFLTEKEITDRINYLSGEDIVGKRLAVIDFHTLEREMEKNPFVQQAQISVDQQQNISVSLVQKRPVLRILNKDGVGYYLSENNERIPLNSNFTPHVVVAVGSVQLHQSAARDSAVQAALFSLITAVDKDEFLHALVDQIYVNDDSSIDLIPRGNNHVIHLGNAEENMDDKLKRLKIFYNEGLKKTGWQVYKAIDLRYMNQVVCEKRDTTQLTVNTN